MTHTWTLVLALVGLLASHHTFADQSDGKSPAEAGRNPIHHATERDREVVRIGEAPFFSINTAGAAKPYLYPIIGPTGVNMTRHYPMIEGVKGESSDHKPKVGKPEQSWDPAPPTGSRFTDAEMRQIRR